MALRPGIVEESGSGAAQFEQPVLIPSIQQGKAPSGPIILEPDIAAPPGRINPVWEPKILQPPRKGISSILWFAGGIVTFCFGWLSLSGVEFVADQFHRSKGFGILTLGFVAISVGLVAVGVLGELRAYTRLKSVRKMSIELALVDLSVVRAKKLCRDWIEVVAPSLADAPTILVALEAFQTVPEIKSYLRHRVIEQLRKAAQQAGRRAALEGGALIAVMPSSALDGITAATRGLILIRQVAQIYGLKPSPFVTFALIRRIAWTAAGVSGLDLLSQSLADHTLQKLPLVQHLAGAVPGTSVAAIRIYRLANITAEACSPLPAN